MDFYEIFNSKSHKVTLLLPVILLLHLYPCKGYDGFWVPNVQIANV